MMRPLMTMSPMKLVRAPLLRVAESTAPHDDGGGLAKKPRRDASASARDETVRVADGAAEPQTADGIALGKRKRTLPRPDVDELLAKAAAGEVMPTCDVK